MHTSFAIHSQSFDRDSSTTEPQYYYRCYFITDLFPMKLAVDILFQV